MRCSTAEGHVYAQANGYILLEAAQAYVIPNATTLTQYFYEGMFTRIMAAYPIDYYWIWTPEGACMHALTDAPPLSAVQAGNGAP